MSTPLQGVVFAETSIDDFNLLEQRPMEMFSLLLNHAQGGLEFTQQQVSLTRGWVELQRAQNACMYNKFKTPERKKKGYFSQHPISVYPPLRLITLKQTTTHFMSPVDLSQPKRMGRKSIGVAHNRSYGGYINDKINRFPELFYIRGGMDSSETLIDMLAKERISGLIEYSEEVNAYLARHNREVELTTLPIKGVEKVDLGYIVCSKTPQGKQLIQRINHIMSQPQFLVSYIEMHKSFFSDDEKRLVGDKIKKIFNQ
ncbi:hypothetical protein ACFOD0_06640 [Shewanella intestini]|uniref:Transporter substrate-binding domain-containing protein n=1 Tax=Shewanella intestini TaxID=2017544 RepID=A0ABS5HZL2_9GAMM|nr:MULTISPECIES: hypothetical protein [Shewanella]MBR9726550.1 hypothetical protein [Shewanella intestini]MRG34884.1 hypothetical protein [Shewanella sp. XMDDZSB0408]